MNLTIRRANNNDLKKIIKLIEEFYKTQDDKLNLNKFDNDLIDIEKTYFDTKGCFWVAESPLKKIVATLAIKYHANNTIELKRLYVDKKHQRQGIASKMVDKAINRTKKIKCHKIFLWTDKRYKTAQLFYKNLGFVQTKETTFYDADEAWNALLFEKEV